MRRGRKNFKNLIKNRFVFNDMRLIFNLFKALNLCFVMNSVLK